MKILITFSILFSSIFSVAQESEKESYKDWEVMPINDEITNYYTHGTTVWGHQFGFLKWKEKCYDDQLFLSWSTYDAKNLNLLDKQQLLVHIQTPEKLHELRMKVVSVMEYTPLLGVFYLAPVENDKLIIESIKNADSVSVILEVSAGVDSLLDIKTDRFSLNGLEESRKKAAEYCNHNSTKY